MTDLTDVRKIGYEIRVTDAEHDDAHHTASFMRTVLAAAERERAHRATMTPEQLDAYDAANLAHAEAARAATKAHLHTAWATLRAAHTHPAVLAVLDLHTPGDWGYCDGCQGMDDAPLWESCDTVAAIREATP